ncbi:MAG TPA: DNA repair protein RecN [Candidatus Dormibacteraeota bacterium]|nr:DNA repair protein RecN [Candidatus Dormibacteraeota bacterium]
MLRELRVRDLALVAESTVRFGPGLNLLTGETGSGKSLIIDALSLALGARGGADQVRHGAGRATVEAVFDSISLEREVGKRGVARVDGRTATPAALREIGDRLVAIHGQHAHHALLDADTQTELVDGYGGALEARAAVAAAHAAWVAAAAALRDLEQLRSRGNREREYLLWQLDELRRADPRPGEDEALVGERNAARNAARLSELGQDALQALHEDGVARATVAITAAAALDPRLAEHASRLDSLTEEIADVAADVRRYTETLDADPARLESIESRLAVLDGIKRKYGGSIEAALAERQRLELQVGASEDVEGAVARAEAETRRRRAELDLAATRLTTARNSAARRMQKAVAVELDGLRLEGARFEVALRPLAEVGATGAEMVEMMFSANPGEPIAPLSRVASGGELARVMLAIKTVGASADRIPTLVFDEVDAGIGGEAAVQVGLRLKKLGSRHQVLVVTHLAQIASFADHHLVVEKARGEDGRNVVAVRELTTGEEKARELARMMSGGVTEKAVARAHELLEEAGRPVR